MATVINVNTVKSRHAFALDPLCFSIRFDSKALPQDLPEHIPIEISVRVPDNYFGQIIPTLECRNPHAGIPQTLEVRSLSFESQRLPSIMFPFFPLPPQFHHLDSRAWASLANEIQVCLVRDITIEQTRPECYQVLRDTFWMAFVAAYPSFPHGEWPRWNPMISMEGNFMSYWMNIDSDARKRGDSRLQDNVREFIWDGMKDIASKCLHMPLEFFTDTLAPSST